MQHAANSRALKFFSGKSLEKAREALQLLDESVKQGFWAKGAARKVRAALNKCNEAVKVVRDLEKKMEAEGHDRYSEVVPFEVTHSLRFGFFERAQEVDLEEALAATPPEHQHVVEYFREYQAAFADIAAAVKRLDATRPKPVFTKLGASPTVTRTVESLGATAVDVCPMEFETVAVVDPKTGKTAYESVAILLWPEGTEHGTSRFSVCKSQCEACGHGIRNPYNWVPLVLTAKDGTPKSLWVGRDCSKTLFGIDLTGELKISGRPVA